MKISKRIQKHLIDRADNMFYDDSVTSYLVDTYLNPVGDVNFMLSAYSQHSGMRDRRCIALVEDLQADMKAISGDMRKWRILKNGS